MWRYNYTPNNDWLAHKGVKGMKWGYTDGKRNGRRVAGEDEENSKSEDKVYRVRVYEDVDSLIGGTQTRTTYGQYHGKAHETEVTTVKRGKLERAAEAGAEFVSSVADKAVSGVKDAISKGKNFIDSLFKKK